MLTINDIERFSFAIADRFHPQRIILFGSHAWGNPSHDSDVDMRIHDTFMTDIRSRGKVIYEA